ncbi:single-stranded DNA-binding protein [candidate division KSB1 bacterium]|nr:single-stranded DNA-binding protein [candidate division KSB1 bacterium]
MAEFKMPDINNVLIAGNLTNDPIFRKTSSGTPVVNFYIASNRKYKDNSGIWRENVCYVGVVAWNKLAEACAQTLKQSSSVLIDGELQSRSWRNEDGNMKNIVEIRARRIQFLDKGAPQNIEENVPFTKSDESDSVTPQEPEKPLADIEVEPTDFDFGYQDLKL